MNRLSLSISAALASALALSPLAVFAQSSIQSATSAPTFHASLDSSTTSSSSSAADLYESPANSSAIGHSAQFPVRPKAARGRFPALEWESKSESPA